MRHVRRGTGAKPHQNRKDQLRRRNCQHHDAQCDSRLARVQTVEYQPNLNFHEYHAREGQVGKHPNVHRAELSALVQKEKICKFCWSQMSHGSHSHRAQLSWQEQAIRKCSRPPMTTQVTGIPDATITMPAGCAGD